MERMGEDTGRGGTAATAEHPQNIHKAWNLNESWCVGKIPIDMRTRKVPNPAAAVYPLFLVMK